MSRHVLGQDRIHPAIADFVQNHYRFAIEEINRATHEHAVVMVGMKQNPFPKRARAILEERGIAFKYFEFGSYFSGWRLRNAIKMWTGWPTMPIIFIHGVLIGGYEDLKRLAGAGESVFKAPS